MPQEPSRPVDQQESQAPQETSQPDQAPQVEAAGPSREQLVQQLESLGQELDQFKDKYLRALADYQNFQKRAAGERIEAVRRGQADMARALLSVLDDFERTMEAAKAAKDVAAVAQGVRIVYDQMVKTLGEFGLQRMNLKPGDPFDPQVHQAVAQQPSDQVEPDHVLHVAQPGYTMRDTVLRPAAVVVARKPEPDQPQIEDGELAE